MVVVDRLAPRVLLDRLDPAVEVVDVGKVPARRRADPGGDQRAAGGPGAGAGKRVVRLKGGDPFVLGRGGEEVAACVAAGVPVEVVPGVSSAIAGPAAAGIPVTHRGVAADFAVVSGHVEPSPDPAGPESSGSVIDWQALADGPATLVLLMALDRVAAVAAELVKRGRPANPGGRRPAGHAARPAGARGDAGHGRRGGRRGRSAAARGGRHRRGRGSARPALGRLAAGLIRASDLRVRICSKIFARHAAVPLRTDRITG